MKISKISIQRPTVVMVGIILILIFGTISYLQLSQELFPRMDFRQVTVGTIYPGAGPSDVEKGVTTKIEDALSSLEGLKSISSVSIENFSIINIELQYGVDIDKTMQDAKRKIGAIKAELPDEIKEPVIEKIDFSQLPMMIIGAKSGINDIEFYDFMKSTIKPSLERINGIGKVELIGGSEREIQINIDEDKLEAYGLSIAEVTRTLIASNIDIPAGKIKDENRQIQIRLEGKYKQVDEINDVVLKALSDGGIVSVKDIAEVYDTQKEATTICRIDGHTSVALNIIRQSDANAVNISKAVKKSLEKFQEEYAGIGLYFDMALDESEFTVESTNSVMWDLFLAIVFVGLIMALFLHSWRNSLIVMVAIPTSLIATFIAMYLMGITLNLASLLALSLVIGILVDDAIVVVENIHRHLEMGKPRAQAVYDAVKEIGMTVLSITTVLIVVFIPASFTQTLMTDLLRSFCLTIAFATLISLLVSFTIVPLMSSRISKVEAPGKDAWSGRFIAGFENIIDNMANSAGSFLKWSFSHKLIVFGVTILLFISSLMLIPLGFIGTEFLDIGDRGEFYVDMELPKNSTIEQSNAMSYRAEEMIRKNPNVEKTFVTVGSLKDGQRQAYLSDILVKLKPLKERELSIDEISTQITSELRRELVGVKVSTVISGLTGGKEVYPVEVYISGDGLEKVLETGDEIMKKMKSIPGMVDVRSEIETDNPEIVIVPDREKMSKMGISMEMLGYAVNLGFNGNTDSKYSEKDNEHDINIRLDDFDRRNIKDVENYAIVNVFGNIVLLNQVASVSERNTPSKLQRRNRMTSLTIIAQVAGRSLGDVGNDLFFTIDNMDLPQGTFVEYGSDLANSEEGFDSLFFALVISIVLVYLIMVLLYNNYIYPLAVMFSIPLALIGALLALALSMEYLSMVSMLGMIMLIGLVAKNAILVVDFANELQDKGMEIKHAIIEATRLRFRPILMTAISTIIGMLPIALASGTAANFKNGLAWVVIGGLLSSTILTLIIVPLVYYLLFRLMIKLGWKKKDKIELNTLSLYTSRSQ